MAEIKKSVNLYVSGYVVYSKSKNTTPKKRSLLIFMLIPERHFDVWYIDFISVLLIYDGFNSIYTCINKLSKYIHLIPCFKGEGELSALEFFNLVFAHIVHLFDLYLMVLHE